LLLASAEGERMNNRKPSVRVDTSKPGVVDVYVSGAREGDRFDVEVDTRWKKDARLSLFERLRAALFDN
jgi:hypothetical protein